MDQKCKKAIRKTNAVTYWEWLFYIYNNNDELCEQIKEDSDAYFKWENNMDPKETGWGNSIALSGSEQVQVADSCGHGNNVPFP